MNVGGVKKHGHAARRSKEYRAWANMIQRTTNVKLVEYPHYGGRGITVCAPWRASFEAFLADAGPAPSPSHSIDRIDVNGNYEPGNVRWATKTEQSNNRRDNLVAVINGKKVSLAEAARTSGLTLRGLLKRLERGLPIDQALNQPKRTHRAKSPDTRAEGV